MTGTGFPWKCKDSIQQHSERSWVEVTFEIWRQVGVGGSRKGWNVNMWKQLEQQAHRELHVADVLAVSVVTGSWLRRLVHSCEEHIIAAQTHLHAHIKWRSEACLLKRQKIFFPTWIHPPSTLGGIWKRNVLLSMVCLSDHASRVRRLTQSLDFCNLWKA